MRKLNVWMGITFAIALLMLIWLVTTGRADYVDFHLREKLLTLGSLKFVDIWRDITLLGSGALITALVIASMTILILRGELQYLKYLTGVMIAAVAIENGLKWMVHRARPTEIFANTMPSSYSFPSGHALFALSFYVSFTVIFAHRLPLLGRMVLWVVTALVVTFIGVSRIFLGVHYPSDVLGGYLAAALCLSLSSLMLRPNRNAVGPYAKI